MIPEGGPAPNLTWISDTIGTPAPVPVWTRRTTTACANCRHDKVKCDGSRPCGRCVKKNFELCIDGCEACRRARARCEDGQPCMRCREMDLECKNEPTGTSLRQAQQALEALEAAAAAASAVAAEAVRQSAAGSTSGPRPGQLKNGDRAKLACLACRRDNKRCDRERPCARCVTRGQACVNVDRGPKLTKLRCEGCREKNGKCEEARPCKHCVGKGIECVDIPRKGRGHGTKVTAACTNCRQDKVRCNGERPCSACKRKEYLCMDRPCRSCIQQGKHAFDCKHHRRPPWSPTSQPQEGTASSSMNIDHEHLRPYQNYFPEGHTQPYLVTSLVQPSMMDPNGHYHPGADMYNHSMYAPSHPNLGGPSQSHPLTHPNLHQSMVRPDEVGYPHIQEGAAGDGYVAFPVIDPALEHS